MEAPLTTAQLRGQILRCVEEAWLEMRNARNLADETPLNESIEVEINRCVETLELIQDALRGLT